MCSNGRELRYAVKMGSYTRREQFKARLKTVSGRTVRGIGVTTMYERKGHGLIVPTKQPIGIYLLPLELFALQ